MIAVTGSTLKFARNEAMKASGASASCENGEQGPFAVVRDQDRKRAAIGDPSEGADQIIARNFHRAAQAHLGHDQRRQNRPERKMQVQGLRQR
jgi:hypothetical protein